MVRALVQEANLLEVEIGEGWERMCKFLGKEVPGYPYPRVNDKEEFGQKMAIFAKAGLQRLIWKAMQHVVLVAMVLGGMTLIVGMLKA